MMQDYKYGNGGRLGGRGGYDRGRSDYAPYRRPMGRGNLPSEPFGTMNGRSGGCGCGMGRDVPMIPQPSPREEPRTLPAMETGTCGGCGDCGRLKEQLRAVDFALYEVILYLDVYPHSCDALETYHKLKAQHEALRKEYEAACAPLTAFGNQSGASWDWIGSPFPWEYGAD